MAMVLTGTDVNGIVATSALNTYITLDGEVVTNAGADAFATGFNGTHYLLSGMVVADRNYDAFDFRDSYDSELRVTATGHVAAFNARAVYSEGSYFSLVNDGTISGDRDAIRISGANPDIENTGLIRSLNYEAIWVSSGVELHNSGTIEGAYGIRLIDVDSLSTTRIVNSGSIVGTGAAVDLSYAQADVTFFNTGELRNSRYLDTAAAYVGGEHSDYIENHGDIYGNVLTADGNDLFEQRDGQVSGKIDLGGGDDILILDHFEATTRYKTVGGNGTDRIDLEGLGHAIWVDLSSWAPKVWTRDSFDVKSGDWRVVADVDTFEEIIGTVGVDYMVGNEADNYFGYRGTALNAGNETIIGKGGTDTVDFSEFESAVWINLESSTREAWTKDNGNVVAAGGTWRSIADMTGIENVVGTYGVDEFQGNAQNNTFVYVGGVGADAILGIEKVNGRTGSDTIDMIQFNAGVWIDLASSVEVWTQDDSNATDGGGNWRQIVDLTSVENIVGTVRSDLLRGDANDNVIDGVSGSDVISGRGGNDTFVFGSTLGSIGGNVTITDFSADDAEKIDLSGVAAIEDFADLSGNHIGEYLGELTIWADFYRIVLTGYTLADFGVGQAINESDFIFA